PPANVTDPNTGNNSALDSDTLSGKTSVGVTLTDNVDTVTVGQVVNYVIEVSNSAGPSNASTTVTDTLPAQLSNGSWVCSGTNGATCAASGSGNSLSDSASLPSGSKVDYIFTATVVSANSSGLVSNTANVKVNGGNNSPSSNMSVSDSDAVV